jgi:hypothetical protein
MRKFIASALLLFLVSVPAVAQNTPDAEVFGGISVLSTSVQTLEGINTSVNGNVNDWLGIKADFSALQGNLVIANLRAYTFAFGPQISYRKHKRVTPFAHALFGGAHASAGFLGLSFSDSSFAMNFGGGLDVVAHRNFAIRVLQVDAVVTRFDHDASTDGRISAGIVFRFGSK